MTSRSPSRPDAMQARWVQCPVVVTHSKGHRPLDHSRHKNLSEANSSEDQDDDSRPEHSFENWTARTVTVVYSVTNQAMHTPLLGSVHAALANWQHSILLRRSLLRWWIRLFRNSRSKLTSPQHCWEMQSGVDQGFTDAMRSDLATRSCNNLYSDVSCLMCCS